MKKFVTQVAVLGGVLLATAAQGALTISFSSLGQYPWTLPLGSQGASINFQSGGGFNFAGPSANAGYGDFQWGDLTGNYFGKFTGGFSYSAPVQQSTTPDLWTSTLTSAGGLTILDDTGTTLFWQGSYLHGSVNWATTGISTIGTAGGLYATATLNIPAGSIIVSPPGHAAPSLFLTDLATYGGVLTLSWSGTQDLNSLYATGSGPLTFAGQITTVPETSTLVAGFGALGLVALLIGRQSRLAQIRK